MEATDLAEVLDDLDKVSKVPLSSLEEDQGWAIRGVLWCNTNTRVLVLV